MRFFSCTDLICGSRPLYIGILLSPVTGTVNFSLQLQHLITTFSLFILYLLKVFVKHQKVLLLFLNFCFYICKNICQTYVITREHSIPFMNVIRKIGQIFIMWCIIPSSDQVTFFFPVIRIVSPVFSSSFRYMEN